MHIDHKQVKMSPTGGPESRNGSFYGHTGGFLQVQHKDWQRNWIVWRMEQRKLCTGQANIEQAKICMSLLKVPKGEFNQGFNCHDNHLFACFSKSKKMNPTMADLEATGKYWCRIKVLKVNVTTGICESRHHFSLESVRNRSSHFDSFCLKWEKRKTWSITESNCYCLIIRSSASFRLSNPLLGCHKVRTGRWCENKQGPAFSELCAQILVAWLRTTAPADLDKDPVSAWGERGSRYSCCHMSLTLLWRQFITFPRHWARWRQSFPCVWECWSSGSSSCRSQL